MCETWLRPNITPVFQNYILLRKDREGNRGGGIAFLIRKDLNLSVLPLQDYKDGLMEVMAVRVAFSNGWGNFLLCYNPCKNITKEELNFYFQQIPSPQFIFGDFNAHHQMWDPKIPKRAENFTGRALVEILSSQQFHLLTTPGLPTRIDIYSGNTTTIDLCFGSGIFSVPTVIKTENNLGSDHFPIIIDYLNSSPLVTRSTRPHWNFNVGNEKWTEFQKNLNKPNNNTLITDEIQSKTDHIIETGIKTFYLGPGRIIKKPARPWWSPECSKAVAVKRRAFNKWKRRPERVFQLEYRRLEAKAKKIIRKTKRICFRKFCSKLNFNSSSSFVWKFIKTLCGTNFSCSLPLSKNGITLITDLAKAELMAEYYVSVIGIEIHLTIEKQCILFIDQCLKETSDLDLNKDFTVKEMEMQIQNLKLKKAVGSDLIPNEFIKYFPDDYCKIILDLFNSNWREGVDPALWKMQQIIPVIKPNKDPSSPSSYRPISLTSCLGKLFEKMIQTRLSWWLESSSLLPDNQCGFRPGRSTTDILLQLEHGVFKGFKEGKVTLVIFFDISKAFDKASHIGILYKLCVLGLRGNSLSWLKSFFQDRFFQVLIGDQCSTKYPVKTGVPQGSVLSPLLFSVLLYDIPHFPGVTNMVLADDITFFTCADSVEEAQLILQRAVDGFLNWVNCWGLSVNPSKSRLMCFTRKRINTIPKITVNEEKVTFVTKHCFLGLILDGPRLTWKHHIDYLKITCVKRLDIMKRIASKCWGSNYGSLITFYKSFIRSKLDYACTVYSSASQTQLKKLDVIQSSALRIATGAFKSSPITSLHIETNLLPLAYWRQIRLATGFVKVQNSHIDHPLFQLFSRDKNDMHNLNWTSNRQVPFLIRASYLLNSLNQSWSNFMNLPVASPIAPWSHVDKCIMKEFPIDAKNCSSIIVKHVFNELCTQEYDDFLHIYTDGSVYRSPVSCTAAIYVPDLDYSGRWHLGGAQSIVAAELFGILKALHFSVQLLEQSKVVIFTDSQVALSLMNGYALSYRVLLYPILSCLQIIQEKEITLSIQWIPSHCGIPGNEYVDKLAKETHKVTVLTNIPVPFKESISLCHTAIWRQWRRDRATELSLSKLHPYRKKNLAEPLITSIDNRKINTCILRLRIGHCSLRHHLFNLKIEDSPDCDCGQIETVEHVLLNCVKYFSKRVRLKHCLYTLGIPFEVKRILGSDDDELMLKKKIFRHLAVFLKSSGLIDKI